jgi:hypothetical protein
MCKLSPAASGALTITGIVLLVLILGLATVLLVAFVKTTKHVSGAVNNIKNGSFVKSVAMNAIMGAIDGAKGIKAAYDSGTP